MKMRTRFSIILCVAVIFSMLLAGCSKKENEDLTVLNHDFTEQQWADFYDAKMASQSGSGLSTSGDATGGTSGSGSATGGNSSGSSSDKDTGSKNDSDDDEMKVIVIDPGHGGKFTGAEGNGIQEKEITLKTAKYIKEYLEEHYSNVEVYLTREKDTELADSLKDDLEERARIAKRHNADALVSIHFNASDIHNRSGTYIYVSRRKHVSAECKGLAKAIMKELVALGTTEGGIEERKSNDMFDEDGNAYDYYAINRHCAARNIPGIIVEQCFMDNEDDRKFIRSDSALKSLAEANAKGIAAYYELKETE